MKTRYPIFTAPELHRAPVLKIFEDFKNEHGEYPTAHQIDRLSKQHPEIPTARTIQNRGGARYFYEMILGIPFSDARTGDRRGLVAQAANLRALADENNLSAVLVKIFGESNVHHRSPYPNQNGTWISSDFKVFTSPTDFFFIDTFSAHGIMNLAGCVNIKVAKLERAKISNKIKIFFISCNDFTSQYQIDQYVKAKKKPLPKNITLLDINTAIPLFKKLASGSVV